MGDKSFNLNDIPTFESITSRVYGEKKNIKEVIGRPIILWKANIRESVYREQDNEPNKRYAKMLFSYEDDPYKKYVVGTSSYYIIDDLISLEGKLPVRVTIIKKQLPKQSKYENTRFAYVFI